ncbi:MAG TPA: NAD(P)-binding protein [Bacteroidia bacterium]|nr:NAD(P)-binding protein [Bacteroidia bacterium]
MLTNNSYDCAIIGGGLGGLCLAIQLADKNYSVIVFEKNEYPFHKVCGEYISMESHDFLASLGTFKRHGLAPHQQPWRELSTRLPVEQPA